MERGSSHLSYLLALKARGAVTHLPADAPAAVLKPTCPAPRADPEGRPVT